MDNNSDLTMSAKDETTGKQITDMALENIRRAGMLATEDDSPVVADSSDNESHKDGKPSTKTDNYVAEQFVGLPIESLICAPIIAAAKGQGELVDVYLDTVKKLAYHTNNGQPDENSTNQITLKLKRPVQKTDGTIATQTYSIDAPLLALVPVPAFLMDEVTVDFNMEVKTSSVDEKKTHADMNSSLGYKSFWGVSANITGNVSSDSSHKRTTDSSATYHITARAIQHPPAEGMAKLVSLITNNMEPMTTVG